MAGYRTEKSGIVLAAVLVAILALIAAACGGSSAGDGDGDSSPAPATAPATATEEPDGEPAATDDPMGDPSSIPAKIEIEARDNIFSVQTAPGVPGTIEAPANTDFTVRLTNEGVLPHNISFFTKEGGAILADGANGAIYLEGEGGSVSFTTPDAGTYFFVCSVHPLEMIGEFVVK